jgi:putative peptide modification system cyclase
MHAMQRVTDSMAGEPVPGDGPGGVVPQVRTLLLTDLCDSTMLVERLGDAVAAELFREHDRLVLALQQRWHGRLIDRSDGLLLLFERAIDGLGFALDYTRGLRDIGERRAVARHGMALRARAGLNVGEVLTWRNSDAAIMFGAKALEVEGLAKPIAARLMAMARPGQILLSATAEPLAHRAARELGERGEQLVWKSWGRWRFKGVPQAQEVHEVGEPGLAPLAMPRQDRAKAWRDIPLWRRPAALAAELLLVAGLVAGAWFMAWPQPAIAFAERDWVVVADLRNLTGDTLLDASLEQAFRISLEQSRYVNVLSDLKARETLGRMRRAKDTPLDRVVASEIAMRDGARAVILPTVAEVGGRVRVSAEVIDPRTQATVYAESADGRGAASTLRSIDRVTAALRGRLGEAIQSIQENSAALPDVTTADLDALKAYAVGHALAAAGEAGDAIGFYERAIAIDPRFALAMVKAGRAYATLGNFEAHRRLLTRAATLRGRLSPREALLLDAELSESGPVEQTLQRWREVVALYPDEHLAQFRLAQAMMFGGGGFEDALELARASASIQSPYAAPSQYLIGMLLLGLERFPESISAFIASRRAGFTGHGVSYAYAYAAQRDYDAAERILAARKPSGAPTGELETFLARLQIALDRQQPRQALAVADAGYQAALHAGSVFAREAWALRRLSVQAITGALSGHSLHAALADELARIESRADGLEREHPTLSTRLMLGLGYVAARSADVVLVERVLAAVPKADVDGFPPLGEMRRVLVAEREAALGRPQAAVRLLAPMAANPDATFPVHSALGRAARAAGDERLARREVDWQAAHRGKAYVEEGVEYFPAPFNIVDTRRETRH